MTAARTLISDALGDIGVLDATETMTAEMATHGLRTLNRIVDRWNAQRLSVFAVREVAGSFSGASATIGPALTINTPHPLRIEEGAYYVKSGISYPLRIWSREDYASVILKSTAGDYPQGIWYDRLIPGTVYVWPVPSVVTEYHLPIMYQFAEFADLDTDYSFPAGYVDAFFYTLCERLPAAYNLPVDPSARAQGMAARRAIKINNTEVPKLSTISDGTGRFNILSNTRQ